MTVAEFHQILREVDSYTDYIYLHVLGEPLLHPDLDEILSLCDQYHKKVILTTNATLLKSRLSALQHACLQTLNVSLHSYYEHRQKDYLANIFECAKVLSRSGVHVNYRFWQLQDGSLNEEMEALLKEVLVHYEIKEPLTYRSLLRFDLAPYTHLHFDALFEWPSLSHAFVGDRGRCYGMKSMCAILCDGTLVPCCLDSKGDISFGNVLETPFSELMKSERFVTMEKQLSNGRFNEALCQRCAYRRRFS